MDDDRLMLDRDEDEWDDGLVWDETTHKYVFSDAAAADIKAFFRFDAEHDYAGLDREDWVE